MKINVGDKIRLNNGHEDVIIRCNQHIRPSYIFGNISSFTFISRDGFKFTQSGDCIPTPAIRGGIFSGISAFNVKEIIKESNPEYGDGLLNLIQLEGIIRRHAQHLQNAIFEKPVAKKKVKKYRWVYRIIRDGSYAITAEHYSDEEMNTSIRFTFISLYRAFEKIESTMKEVEIDA